MLLRQFFEQFGLVRTWKKNDVSNVESKFSTIKLSNQVNFTWYQQAALLKILKN